MLDIRLLQYSSIEEIVQELDLLVQKPICETDHSRLHIYIYHLRVRRGRGRHPKWHPISETCFSIRVMSWVTIIGVALEIWHAAVDNRMKLTARESCQQRRQQGRATVCL